MGAVWISGAGPSADVDAEIARLNSDFSSRFGEPKHRLNVDESFFGSAFWKPLSLWREKPPQANYLIAKDRDQHPLALAWLAASQLATPFSDYDPVSQAADPIVVAQKFVPQAGLPAERMQALLQTELSLIKGNGQQKLDDTEFVNTIADWVKAAAGLDVSHRAAALLVADRALDAGGGYSNLEVRSSETGGNVPTAESNRKKLEGLGATFHYSELDGGYLYQHDWLKQAQALSANRQVGDAIFVDLLDRGFDTSGTCAVSEQFRRVIREGKQYLTAHPQTAAAAEILMAIADANRDIVALADGAAPGYSNSKTYAAEKNTARVSAIDDYRQTIAATTDEALKQKATRSAWELIAGIEPAKTRFFCVYD
ncbi:MAG TPA: hypothetical protein VFQ00_13765 [Terriglobales bacterium]|nr:hypothetical protein [Terriglobales bacterium]